MKTVSRSEFLKFGIASFALSQTLAGCALAEEAGSSPLGLSVTPVELDPSAREALAVVRLPAPPEQTTLVEVRTRDGGIINGARAGVHYAAVEDLLIFKPGDDPFKLVRVPILQGEDGRSFDLIASTEIDWAMRTAPPSRITFRSGAFNQQPAPYARPLHRPSKGKLVYEMDFSTFTATESGFHDGWTPCWKTGFSRGRRTQPSNSEPVIYTDAKLHPGTRPFEIRNGELVMRVERFPTPRRHTDGNTYPFSASVLTAETLKSLHLSEFYIEIDASLPSLTHSWPALWVLPADGSWPPEIDIMEQFNKPGSDPNSYHLADHWLNADRKKDGTYIQAPVQRMGFPGTKLQNQYNVYGCELRPDRCTKYFNGVELWSGPNRFKKAGYPLFDITMLSSAPKDLVIPPGSNEFKIRRVQIWA